jgi:hypothetical protein
MNSLGNSVYSKLDTGFPNDGTTTCTHRLGQIGRCNVLASLAGQMIAMHSLVG